MFFIDTHCHLYHEEFDNDRDEVISRTLANNVKKIILPNIDTTSIKGMHYLQNKYPQIFFTAIGIHPSSVKENYLKELKIIEQELENPCYCAIGEIGLDFYWDKTFIKEQKIAFEKQLNFAIQKNLPVIIHSRNSMDETLEIIKNYSGLKGVFHCFSGNLEQAKETISLGFKLGITGVVTYKNSGLSDIIKEIDLENIFLETDAPFLTPIPHRGKRNESSYIPIIAQKIAEIKNISSEKVAETTTKSAEAIFNI